MPIRTTAKVGSNISIVTSDQTVSAARGLRVKTRVQAGGYPVSHNHNETQAQAGAAPYRKTFPCPKGQAIYDPAD